jgi:hypothetical protein
VLSLHSEYFRANLRWGLGESPVSYIMIPMQDKILSHPKNWGLPPGQEIIRRSTWEYFSVEWCFEFCRPQIFTCHLFSQISVRSSLQSKIWEFHFQFELLTPCALLAWTKDHQTQFPLKLHNILNGKLWGLRVLDPRASHWPPKYCRLKHYSCPGQFTKLNMLDAMKIII